MEEITQPREAVGAATIAEAFRITAADRADEVAVRTKGDEIAWTWGELRERVDALAGRARPGSGSSAATRSPCSSATGPSSTSATSRW